MLVDLSGSIIQYPARWNNWILLRRFLKDFVEITKQQYKDSIKLALVTFANQGNVKFRFDDCSDSADVTCMTDIIQKLNSPVGTEESMR